MKNETGTITIRYWASARSVAGTDAEKLDVDAPLTLSEVLRRLGEAHTDGRLLTVLDACSVLLVDRPVSTENPDNVIVPVGSTLEFLPPFAGG